jgi:ankyrin repeat protein
MSNTQSEDNTSRAPTASLKALTVASSPSPKLSFAEKLQAKKQREESTQKLFRAVSLNKIDNVKELLEMGADPNVLGKRQDTSAELFPIHIAATNKFNEVLRLLIQHKAKVDVVSPGYGTALHGAISFRNQEGVEALLEGGADPNKVDPSGYSPLQNAAQYSDNDPGILDALLLADAEINLKTSIGTALDCALGIGQFKTARVLLNAGADPDLVKDNYQHIFKNVPA